MSWVSFDSNPLKVTLIWLLGFVSFLIIYTYIYIYNFPIFLFSYFPTTTNLFGLPSPIFQAHLLQQIKNIHKIYSWYKNTLLKYICINCCLTLYIIIQIWVSSGSKVEQLKVKYELNLYLCTTHPYHWWEDLIKLIGAV